MFKRTRLISVAAMAALLASGIATATYAASDAKKKVTHASKPAAKTAKRTAPGSSSPQYPTSSNYSY
jgi:hypothetical protein